MYHRAYNLTYGHLHIYSVRTYLKSQLNTNMTELVRFAHSLIHIKFIVIIGERDTLSRSSMENAISIYIYIYKYARHTLVARFWGHIMWEELSVSHF